MIPPGSAWITWFLGCAVLLAGAMHHLAVARMRLIVGPESYFLAMATGTFFATAHSAIGSGSVPALLYANFMGAGVLAFVLGCVTCTVILRFDHRVELKEFIARPWRDDLVNVKRTATLAVGVVGVGVTAAYFYELGTYVPWEALEALLTAGPSAMIDTYSAARRDTRVGTYLGLGYVIQFKDCLLPLVTLLLLVKMRMRAARGTGLWVGVFLLASLAAAVGTGSRFALASFGALVCVVGVAPYLKPFRFSRKEAVAVAVGALVLLSALTLMMGPRGQEVPFAGTPLWAPYQVMERVFIGPAQERLLVFELFLADAAPQWGGAALETLQTALPGRRDYTLSNELHELLYGNPDGNVALDVWGILWYDWQWGGLVVVFIIGFLFHAFYVRVLRGPKKLIRVVSLTYAGFVLGLATDLQVLLLRGFGTLLIFLLLVEFLGMLPRPSGRVRAALRESSSRA